MTPIHLIGSTYCMPIPEDASAIETHVTGGIQKIVFSSKIQDPAQCGGDMVALPPGNWEIISTTKEITENQAKEVVGSSEWFFPVRHTRYVDYGHPCGTDNKQAWSIGFSGPRDSFRSLLASRGLNPETNYVIIKKVS